MSNSSNSIFNNTKLSMKAPSMDQLLQENGDMSKISQYQTSK